MRVGTILEVDDVSVTYGGLQALDAVSLDVAEGEVVGLIGPNGAGKTTLFNVVSGLVRPDRGAVRFVGEDITDLKPHARAARGVGRSFQNLALIHNESALVNVMAAQHLSCGYRGSDILLRPRRWWSEERRVRRRAMEVLDAFGLAPWANEPIEELSFAAARRVELACVLVEGPRLMLLDEPTTGLDPGEVEQLVGVLRGAQGDGTSVLLVAHDVRFVMSICQRTYVLSEGRVLVEGSPTTVQSHPRVIEAYLGRST